MNPSNKRYLLMSVVGVIGVLPYSAPAVDLGISQRPLSNLELFNRCYSHLTQRRLSINHPLRAAVASGTKSPIDACMQVLSEANLNASGTIATPTTVNGNNESLSVLQAFSAFHHTLTDNPELDNSVPEGTDRRGTRLVYDEGEFGLHFTRALFTPGASVADIVTLPVGVEAIRSNGSLSSYTNYMAVPPLTSTIPTVQMGNLLGIRLMSANPVKASLSRTLGGLTMLIHKSDGGGVLGTQSYILSNLGRAIREKSNGGTVMPRRYARAVYKDLLCRDIPVIRPTDATGFVTTVPTAKTPSFRTGAACMQCHASIDPMSATVRNFSYISDNRNPNVTDAIHAYKHPVTLPAETGVVENDPSFYQRPSNGRLFFRSYDGTLVDRPVTSIADLGARIAETDDFYVCTASRYYKFFTGIEANLQDAGDPSRPALSSGDLFYRNEVIRLGKNLKTSKNLQTLIREIISSDIYRRLSNRSAR